MKATQHAKWHRMSRSIVGGLVSLENTLVISKYAVLQKANGFGVG